MNKKSPITANSAVCSADCAQEHERNLNIPHYWSIVRGITALTGRGCPLRPNNAESVSTLSCPNTEHTLSDGRIRDIAYQCIVQMNHR